VSGGIGEYILYLLLLLLLFGPLIDDSPIPKKNTKTTVMAQLWVFIRGFLMAITCSNPAGPRCYPPRPLCPPGRPGLWPHDIAWSEYKAPPVRCAAAAGTFSGINGGVVVFLG